MISKDTAMAEKTKKVREMFLKVDLECYKCYKKVKRILCKFPQIQDQVYNEKNNTVKIKVVCCSPENIRDEICYKGRGTIKSIEMKKVTFDLQKQTAPAPAPELEPEPAQAPAPAPKQAPAPALALAYSPGPVPIGFYCTECSERRGGGPVRYCDGYCGRPVYDSWGGGGNRPYYGSHYSEYYFNEDNSQGCTIM
ncbi:hypothetical protein LWI29_023387 [Acer saccharum]|uniref:Uncharacterized protein n=1 Tax=Acer saccharum TaxID=4024 RepID=A0AA39W272_ACESA|nr:hypothetical protein LWI29_023387 [Acer saccharum]